MVEIIKTVQYSQWLDNLFDTKVRARIQARIERLAWGNPGDSKSVGEKVFEMRVDFGPGYRIYYTKKGVKLVILLIGGNKSTQSRDIKIAHRLAKNL
jgi:putative addiction module killer protein